MHLIGSFYTDISRRITIYHDVSRCITMYHDLSRCITMYHDVSRYITMPGQQNVKLIMSKSEPVIIYVP